MEYQWIDSINVASELCFDNEPKLCSAANETKPQLIASIVPLDSEGSRDENDVRLT